MLLILSTLYVETVKWPLFLAKGPCMLTDRIKRWLCESLVLFFFKFFGSVSNSLVYKWQCLLGPLLWSGADVKAKTPNGRTALHIAAAQGMNSAVEVLLNNGSIIDDPDNDGKTPLVLAGLWGHKSCERQIFLFQWQQRAAKQKPIEDKGGRMAHQMFDSKLKTWLEGPYAQMYCSQIVPPGEFTGTSLSAPRRKHRPSSAPSDDRHSVATDASSERYFELVDGKECGVQVRLGVESLKNVSPGGAKKQSKG